MLLDFTSSKGYDPGMSQPFDEQLRQAIERSGLSRYAISRATGIDQATLSRFMAGRMGMSLESINRVVAVLGLTLVPTTRERRRTARTQERDR